MSNYWISEHKKRYNRKNIKFNEDGVIRLNKKKNAQCNINKVDVLDLLQEVDDEQYYDVNTYFDY